MATASRTAARFITHDNYSATLLPIVRPVSQRAVYVTVSNRATIPGDAVGVSFDGGTTFYTIDEGSSFSFEIWGISNYTIKGLVNPVNVECLYGIEG